MAVQPTGNDVTVAYTTQELVQRFLPNNAIFSGSPTAGKVTTTQFSDIVNRYSRRIDAMLHAKGFQTPFPDISDSDPSLPPMIEQICTNFVVGEIATIVKFGNRKSARASTYMSLAEDQLMNLIDNPGMIGYGRVSSPENFNLYADVGTNQYAKLTANYYRFKNLSVVINSVRFVNSAGTEVFRPDGLPFDYGRDWSMVSWSEGVYILLNETQVIESCGDGGGVVYEFSWRRLSYGQGHPQPITGVSRI